MFPRPPGTWTRSKQYTVRMDSATGNTLLDRIVFVLDRPKELANVGAVVRLLGNFGFSRLRLVEPAAFDQDKVLRFARRGESVAARVERYPSLALSLADCALVLGATRRERALNRPVLCPRQVADVLSPVLAHVGDAGESSQAIAAILFGPEDFGLSNTALDRCHAIVTIPATPHDASLNLAQAVAIVAYEIFVGMGPDAPAPSGANVVPAALIERVAGTVAVTSDLDALFNAVNQLITALYDPPIEGRTKVTMSKMRALFLRAVPRADETRLLTTVFEHAARELRRREQ